MTLDDAQLLSEWIAGKEAAGQALFARHFDSVARFFRNKVDGPIDDLVQLTFVGCIEGRERLRDPSGFRAYLFGIARNVLSKHWRARARPGATVDFDVMSICDLGASPTSAYARDRGQLAILNALRRIPLEAQVMLELSYWESLTAREIAEMLAIPLGTAKTRMRRAKALLATRLGDLASGRLPIRTTATRLETWASDIRRAR